MATIPEILPRLLDDAKLHASSLPSRSKLAPLHEAIVCYRAGRLTYEQLTARLVRHGVTISPSAVAIYCRRYVSKAELERARRLIESTNKSPAPTGHTSGTGITPASGASASASFDTPRVGRGPKIARDDY